MPRVLLVDDDIAEISAVKRVLARAGHQPVLATNSADALAALAQATPALLLVGAGCENGDALRQFADAEAARGIPMVVLGESDGAPAGAFQIARPIDPDQLATSVASALAALPAAGPPAPSRPAAAPPRARAAAANAGGARRAAAPATAPRTNGAPGDAARRAAAEALRARAEELRRASGASAAVAPARPVQRANPGLAAADAALEELRTPAPAPLAVDLDADPGLEAILRRAEDAERAHAAEKKARARQTDRATVEARQRAEAEQVAIEKAARARSAEEHARVEERARAQAERRAREDAKARAQAEADRRAAEEQRRAAEEQRRAAEAQRQAAEEHHRAAEEEARKRAEEGALRHADDEAQRTEEEGRRAAEAQRRTEEEKRRAAASRERARAEREARVDLEGELERLRRQAEQDSRRREADEEELRTAIASARAEMEALRRRGEEESRRREDAEAEVSRLAREAERKIADAAAQPAAFEFPVYRPAAADPPRDPAQESARRRVAALRERAAPQPGPARAEDAPAGPDTSPRPIRAPPAELRSGTFAELPAPRLLALAARAQVSGRIDVQGEVARSIYLDEGRIVGATSSDPSDRVEELALRLGLLTRDQHRLVAAAAPVATRRAAVLLVERGFVKPGELTGLVRRHTEEVVFGAFGDAGARFRWAAAEAPPDERAALERTTLQLAVEGVRRRWLAPQVDQVLGGEATLLTPVATGPTPAELGLSQEERRALAVADGLRTVDEIVAASPLDPLSTRQALAALVLVGALAVRTFQGGRSASAATVAIDLGRLRDKVDQVRRADYFTILGVGRLCTPHEVRGAYERLRAEFDPQRFQGLREDGLEERLEEIRRVVADARDVLADDRLRDEYLRGLGE